VTLSAQPLRVGLLGGSFDPVHDAHLELARRALAQIPCDEIWFIPAATAPHKPEGAVASGEHRRAMLDLAVAQEPRVSICDIELRSEPGQRSVETLRALSVEHPSHEWFWILGEDSWRALPNWVEPEALLAMAAPVVLERRGSGAMRRPEAFGVRAIWLEGAPIDLSSTAIRAALARGDRPAGLPTPVFDYILEHGLYERRTKP
jgi:nicotinate-nucleotide adenylyltransferase